MTVEVIEQALKERYITPRFERKVHIRDIAARGFARVDDNNFHLRALRLRGHNTLI